MALSSNTNTELPRTSQEYLYDVVDVTKDKLKSLKQDIDFSQEVNFDKDLDQLNIDMDRYFNGFLQTDRNTVISLDTGKQSKVSDIILSNNKTDMDALTRYVLKESRFLEKLDQFETKEVRETIKLFMSELTVYKKNILQNQNTNDPYTNTLLSGPSSPDWSSPSSDLEWSYTYPDHYVQPYEVSSYTNVETMHIENIYKNTRVRRTLEKIFDNEKPGSKELTWASFNVNLSLEDGLAGIIIAFREAMATHNQLFSALQPYISTENGQISFDLEAKDIKQLIKQGLITYKKKTPTDLIKIAKIFTRAQWWDLDTFASLLQSKPNIAMAVKEWNNALEMTGNSRNDKEANTSTLITWDNVLSFLCDFNSDGLLSASYNKTHAPQQKNQGDVGTMFGQQVAFTIEQAIKVKWVELNDKKKWEQFVIGYILQHMQMSDHRNLHSLQRKKIMEMQSNPKKCTKENLAILVNGNGNDIPPMPELKIFFLDSIKKINGGSMAVTPDLYDTLTGKDSEYIITLAIEQQNKERKLKSVLDDILCKSTTPAIVAEIEKHGLIRVRETLFLKIMNVLNHVEITLADNPKTQLQSPWIDKWRLLQETQNELLDTVIQQLLHTGIAYSTTWGLRLMIGYGKEGMSTSGKTKRSRWAGAGVIFQADAVEIACNLGWEIAEQYNHTRVINADLSKVISARYVGIQGWALAGIKPSDRWVGAEAYVWLNRQQDPLVGIDQLDQQYQCISEEIFIFPTFSPSLLENPKAFQQYFYQRITMATTDSVYGSFVQHNEAHLRSNVDFIVKYMDTHRLFGSASPLLTSKNPQEAVALLVQILQAGNHDLRRHDVIAALHGKVDLTKLSFGVTTNALTLQFTGSDTPPPPPSTGVDGSPEGTPQGIAMDRFGIYGFFVWGRISTRKNRYAPNAAQYLFTQYEMDTWAHAEQPEQFTSLDRYAAYLQALYNDDKRLQCKQRNGKLVITFTPEWPGSENLTLANFLNLYATDAAQWSFSLNGNTLTIGDVGDIAAYTATEAGGVRRILCLWTKALSQATRIYTDIWPSTPSKIPPITFTEAGYLDRDKTNILRSIGEMKWTGPSLETAKRETALFFDPRGNLIRPQGIQTTFEPATIEGKPLQTWSLSFQKYNDGTFLVRYSDTPKDKLLITYSIYATSQSAPETITTSLAADNLLVFTDTLAAAKTELTTLLTTLIELENNNPTAYAQFLKSASTAQSPDKLIDAEELTQAITYLEQLLGNNNKFARIKEFLHTDDRSVKSYVIDRFKQILARENMYHGMKVGSILDMHMRGRHHRDAFTGPSQLPLSDTLKQEMTEARKQLKQHYGSQAYINKSTSHIDTNLIGYTAFYRPKEQTYSLTALGDTSYIGELKSLSPAAAQEWFLENFKMNKDEVELFAKALEAKLRVQWISVSLRKDSYLDTFATIEKLLQWKSIPIDSWKEIRIDLKWVFYLLGDCCNESLWVHIDNIHITSIATAKEQYTTQWIPTKKYTGGISLWNKNHSIASHVHTQEMKVGATYHHSIQAETPPDPNPTDVDPIDPSPTIVDPLDPTTTVPD